MGGILLGKKVEICVTIKSLSIVTGGANELVHLS